MRQALLWDIDGTLIDTTDLIVDSLDFTYRKHIGRSLPRDEIRALIGTPLREQICVFGDPATLGATADEMLVDFVEYYEAHRDQERLIPEAIECLRKAHRCGRPTALITSKNHVEVANTLPRLGIEGYVDLVISADDVVNPKPDPEGILKALDRFGITRDEAVFIGDTVHDLRAGAGAGVARLAVTWGACPRPLLVAEAPEAICDDPAELVELLQVHGC